MFSQDEFLQVALPVAASGSSKSLCTRVQKAGRQYACEVEPSQDCRSFPGQKQAKARGGYIMIGAQIFIQARGVIRYRYPKAGIKEIW